MILITGAGGQLGYSLQQILKARNRPFEAADIRELDLTDFTVVEKFVDEKRISLIINCGTTTMSWKHDSFTWQCVQFLFYTLYNLSIITTRQVCSTYTLVKQCVTDKHYATRRQIKSHTTSRMAWYGEHFDLFICKH